MAYKIFYRSKLKKMKKSSGRMVPRNISGKFKKNPSSIEGEILVQPKKAVFGPFLGVDLHIMVYKNFLQSPNRPFMCRLYPILPILCQKISPENLRLRTLWVAEKKKRQKSQRTKSSWGRLRISATIYMRSTTRTGNEELH